MSEIISGLYNIREAGIVLIPAFFEDMPVHFMFFGTFILLFSAISFYIFRILIPLQSTLVHFQNFH